jgi:LysR family hydrogen peroxide-inducible transcriptional activator
LTLQQLEYAVALQQFGSFGRAARSAGISQPALSVQIKKLEEEIGLMLFDRSRKTVRPTEAGLRFLERAQLLLTQARQLKDIAIQMNEEISGALRIGIIPTLAPYLLPLFMEKLQEQYQHLQIHIKEALTDEIIQDIKSGELDGGIISTPIESKVKFSNWPLFYERFQLFVSREHPLYVEEEIAISQIAYQDIWLLREGNCFRDQVDSICETARGKGVEDSFSFESNSIESLCRIVEFRGGITFLPELSTLQIGPEREDMLKGISGPPRVRTISLIHLPGQVRRHLLEHFAGMVRANLPKHLLEPGDAEIIPTKVRV